MTPKAKQVLKKCIDIVFYTTVLLYLLACLTPYISPEYFFGFTFLALVFPVLLVAMLLWLLVFLFKQKKKSLLIFFIVLLGYKNIYSNIGFNFFNSHKNEKSTNTFRLLSWNVNGFLVQIKGHDTIGNPFRKMIDYIEKTNVDIVCLQDFETTSNALFIQYIDIIKDSLQFPYTYFSVDIDSTLNTGRCRYGTCIFSKFPITNTGSIAYTGKYFSESLGYADVAINNTSIRVFNTHLRSMYLNILHSKQFAFKYVIEDTMLVYHSSKLEKLKRFDTAHISQARLIKKVMDTTKMPFIFCADLNSVPSSYTYHYIAKNLNDAFVKNSFWWDKTYTTKLPFIRIDVVLTSKELTPVSYSNPKLKLSDHYPVIVDIAY